MTKTEIKINRNIKKLIRWQKLKLKLKLNIKRKAN